MTPPLDIDEDALATCVQCGLCLPHCPTWRATGSEARSPRGRIDILRNAHHNGAPLDSGFAEAIESCVGCRGCETACPSAVPYGELLDAATRGLAGGPGPGHVPRWQRLGIASLDRPALVRAGALAVAIGQRLGLATRGSLKNVPRLPMRRPAVVSTGDDVVLLTGCVMDATQRNVHAAAVSVLGVAGFGVRLQPEPGCCGALAAHRGLTEQAHEQLRRLVTTIPAGVPVISDAAGCGAAIVEAGAAQGADGSVRDLAGRTVDISTFLLEHADRLPSSADPALHPPVVIAQPCHLRNVIGEPAASAVPELLARYVEVRHTDDDDLCCGAGGSHSVLRPHEAAAIRDLKVAALQRSGAGVVVSANPGCAMHLQAGGMLVEHPVEVLARVLPERSRSAYQGDHGDRRTADGR